MSLAIVNGSVYQNGKLSSKHILIEDGTIKKVTSSKVTAKKTINATGKLVLPGMIDTHVHLRDFEEKDKETWETGTKAAVAGGITTVCDMPNNKTPIASKKVLDSKIKHATKNARCNFGCYMIIDNTNISDVNKAKPIAAKLYYGMTTGGNSVDDAEEIFKKLDKKVFLAVHAEDNKCMEKNEKKYKNADNTLFHTLIRDNAAEEIAVKEVIRLAKKYNRQVHVVHISTVEALDLVTQAKKDKVKITCEVCPHHLFLDIGDYKVLKNYGRMNPSLKYNDDTAALWDGITFGDIDSITTDHAPHLKKDKEKPYVDSCSGVPGVETSLPLMLDAVNREEISLQQVVSLMSEKPAQLFRMKNKGKIKEDYDADITIVDMNKLQQVKNKNVVSKCGWSPFDGWELQGWPVMTIVNGTVAFENGKINNSTGKHVNYNV